MQMVVDANILFAAAIRHGKTAELLFSDDLELFSPEFIFEELEKHKQGILGKTHRSPDEFGKFLSILFERIRAVPAESYKHFEARAQSVSPDPDDVPYFALALKLSCPVWSNDKELKKQPKIRVFTTEELLKLL